MFNQLFNQLNVAIGFRLPLNMVDWPLISSEIRKTEGPATRSSAKLSLVSANLSLQKTTLKCVENGYSSPMVDGISHKSIQIRYLTRFIFEISSFLLLLQDLCTCVTMCWLCDSMCACAYLIYTLVDTVSINKLICLWVCWNADGPNQVVLKKDISSCMLYSTLKWRTCLAPPGNAITNHTHTGNHQEGQCAKFIHNYKIYGRLYENARYRHTSTMSMWHVHHQLLLCVCPSLKISQDLSLTVVSIYLDCTQVLTILHTFSTNPRERKTRHVFVLVVSSPMSPAQLCGPF